MSNYKKKYRWQCKLFDNEPDATKFSVEGATKNDTSATVLLVVHPMTPNIMRPMVIQNIIKNVTCQIDIVE
jgi:hypothetical protein